MKCVYTIHVWQKRTEAAVTLARTSKIDFVPQPGMKMNLAPAMPAFVVADAIWYDRTQELHIFLLALKISDHRNFAEEVSLMVDFLPHSDEPHELD